MNLLQRLDAILRAHSTSEDDYVVIQIKKDFRCVDMMLSDVEYSIGFVLDDTDDDIIESVQHVLKARSEP